MVPTKQRHQQRQRPGRRHVLRKHSTLWWGWALSNSGGIMLTASWRLMFPLKNKIEKNISNDILKGRKFQHWKLKHSKATKKDHILGHGMSWCCCTHAKWRRRVLYRGWGAAACRPSQGDRHAFYRHAQKCTHKTTFYNFIKARRV